ncbi:hypothetical protein L9F63_009094, partial [Diploptera punctata]
YFVSSCLEEKTTAGAVCATVAATPVCPKDGSCGISKAMEDASKSEKSGTCKNCKVRPSELPIYGCDETRRKEKEVEEASSLELMIGAARKEIWTFYDQYKGIEKRALEIVETGKAHSESTITFLREEATTVHRAGAIGVGGLAGIIMGLRGGWFRRLLYGSTGAAAMAAICYPHESAEIGQESLQLAKYYFTIVYHFIYGAKPEGFKFLGTEISSTVAPPVLDKAAAEPAPKPVEVEKPPQLERDQSNPADRDLYTTRS